MEKMKASIKLQTAFGEYTLDEILGEGGAGRVYGGVDDTAARVAIKVLTQSSTDKKRRFKNETAFLASNKHANIVSVIDYGVASDRSINGPFYVMRQYAGNLRKLMVGLAPSEVMKLFSQVLDGVEAAHLRGVIHRDLKPENVLFGDHRELAIADFGIASFTDDQSVTLVETAPTQRLANFQYGAPEQRAVGKVVTIAADIYALGLMLNEMFTGHVPHGTDYQKIGDMADEYRYLDDIVSKMIKQNPQERPATISDVKRLIQLHEAEAVSLQRLSQINDMVIRAGEIDDPLALVPPTLVAAHWDRGTLRLTLDRPATQAWIHAFMNMGSFTWIQGAEPQRFQFRGQEATIPIEPHSAQMVIDHFKEWLPQATRLLKQTLENEARRDEARERARLQTEREAEERRIKVNRDLRI